LAGNSQGIKCAFHFENLVECLPTHPTKQIRCRLNYFGLKSKPFQQILQIIRVIDPHFAKTTVGAAILRGFDRFQRRWRLSPAHRGGWLDITGQTDDFFGMAFRALHIFHRIPSFRDKAVLLHRPNHTLAKLSKTHQFGLLSEVYANSIPRLSLVK
jgi:hypothetical protein